MKTLLLSSMAAVAFARCSNDCSGKGTCNSANQCICFRNFHGPDCSRRVCPFSKAFVDNQLGDTNGDNEVSVRYAVMEGKYNTPQSELYSANYAAARDSFQQTGSWDEAHFNRECSNKGLCDDTSGLCTCFPGYEGTACARISCPKGCSGHGQCKNYEGTQYMGWDKSATTYCDCDAGYSGAGCENRECPSGIDPVQAANLDTSRFQRISFRGIESPGTQGADRPVFGDIPFGDVFWTVTLTDEYGDEWVTETLTVKYDVYTDNVDAASAVSYFSYPRLLNKDETIGEYSRKHVAQTLQDALDELPHNVAGKTTVHEIYTMSAMYGGATTVNTGPNDVRGDSAWYDTNHEGLYCMLDDIYPIADQAQPAITTALQGITGCGLMIPSFANSAGTLGSLLGRTVGDDTVLPATYLPFKENAEAIPDRDGNWDIKSTLAALVDPVTGAVTDNPDAIPGRLGVVNNVAAETRTATDPNIEALSLVLPVCEKLPAADGNGDIAQPQTVFSLYTTESSADAGIMRLTDGTIETLEILSMDPAINSAENSAGDPCHDSTLLLGYGYYQWPHANNDHDATTRFPLFFDPENAGTFVVGADPSSSCDPLSGADCNVAGTNAYPGFTDTLRHNQHLVFDPTHSTAGELVPDQTSNRNPMGGLNLFVYFNKDNALHTASDNEKHPLRVDYYYNNPISNLFDDTDAQSATIPRVMGRTIEGYYADGTSQMSTLKALPGGTFTNSDYELVRVDDFTSARVWDVSYHGIKQYFLGQNVPSDATSGQEMAPVLAIGQDLTTELTDGSLIIPTDSDAILHKCSKRGLCDYTTGLCNCFSGYTGAGCGEQNALAF